jgi:hypothetical protein
VYRVLPTHSSPARLLIIFVSLVLILVPWLSVTLAFTLGTFVLRAAFPFALFVFGFRHWFPPRLNTSSLGDETVRPTGTQIASSLRRRVIRR